MNTDQMIKRGNDALFELRSSRERHNVYWDFFERTRNSRGIPNLIIPKGTDKSDAARAYYYSSR